MPSEPEWLPVEAVIEINHAAVAVTGERHLVRDGGLLESALARPQNALAYGDGDMVAFAVMAGIARAHAFEQGNKRTAFIAMVQFLNANGLDVAIEDSTNWADLVISLIEHRLMEEDFARALRPHVTAR